MDRTAARGIIFQLFNLASLIIYFCMLFCVNNSSCGHQRIELVGKMYICNYMPFKLLFRQDSLSIPERKERQIKQFLILYFSGKKKRFISKSHFECVPVDLHKFSQQLPDLQFSFPRHQISLILGYAMLYVAHSRENTRNYSQKPAPVW